MMLPRLCRNYPVLRVRDDVDNLFDRFFGGAWDLAQEGWGRGAGWVPSLDISESETEVTVRAEVPGVDPKDIDVTVSGQMMTISGEKKESTETKEENVCRAERRFGSFRRSVRLPASVDPDKVSAEHNNGVLLIRLGKRLSAVPKRIPVQSAD